jgi:hypothetical protein
MFLKVLKRMNRTKEHTREAHLLLVLTLCQECGSLGQPQAACVYVHSEHAQEAAQEGYDSHNHEELLWQTLHICCPARCNAIRKVNGYLDEFECYSC